MNSRCTCFALALALAACDGASGPEPVDAASIGDPYVIDLDTSAGAIAITVTPAQSPRGAARLRELVEAGYYDDSKFFRVVPGFVVQFGIAADPTVSARWTDARIDDDAVVGSNTAGTVTFATAGPNTRTTQLFINLADNTFLDEMGFSPLGEVTMGFERVGEINSEYGEAPDQRRIQSEGNAYLDATYPNLSTINTARIRE